GCERICSRVATVSFFFQAEDGIRDYKVTGVQTCALPISRLGDMARFFRPPQEHFWRSGSTWGRSPNRGAGTLLTIYADTSFFVSLYVKDAHSTDADRLLG